MKLRTSCTLLGLLILTGAFRSEAADGSTQDLAAKLGFTLDGTFEVPSNIFNFGTNGSDTGTFSPQKSTPALPR